MRADPRLCLAAALIGINLGRPEEARPWLDSAETALARPGAPGDADDLAANIASGRSFVLLLEGDAPEAVEVGRRALALSAQADAWTRAVAWLALGIALYAIDERAEAYPMLEEVVAISEEAAARAASVVALGHLASGDIERGDLALAERRALQAIDLASAGAPRRVPPRGGRARRAGPGAVAPRRARRPRGRTPTARVTLARRGHSGIETRPRPDRPRRGATSPPATRTRRARAWRRPGAMLAAAPGHLYQHAMAERGARGLIGPSAAAEPPGGGDLTDRELAVLRRLTGDGSAREIAADLYVSHNTVKTQMRAIYRKLGVATREDAVARARERGLLPGTLAGRWARRGSGRVRPGRAPTPAAVGADPRVWPGHTKDAFRPRARAATLARAIDDGKGCRWAHHGGRAATGRRGWICRPGLRTTWRRWRGGSSWARRPRGDGPSR